MHYIPIWPEIAFALTLLAIPLALIIRRVGGATRQRRLPRGWRADHVVVFAACLTAVYVSLSLLADLLHPLSHRLAALPTDDATGHVAATLGSLLAHLGWLGWQGLMLALPVFSALAFIAELRWPRTPLVLLLHATAWPLIAGVAALTIPPDLPGVRLLAFTLTPLLALLVDRVVRGLPGRWIRWRAQEVPEFTRVSSLPAAMAAAFHAEAPPVQTPLPTLGPAPAPSARPPAAEPGSGSGGGSRGPRPGPPPGLR